MTAPVLPSINTPVAGLPGEKSLRMDPIWYRYFRQNQQQSSQSLVFDIRDFSPDGNDISQALRSARDAVNDNGSGIIWIPPFPGGGSWVATSDGGENANGVLTATVLLGSNTIVEGGGTIDFQTTTDKSCIFAFCGSASTFSLASNISKNFDTITLVSNTGIAAEDLLLITGNDSNGLYHTSIHRVDAVNFISGAVGLRDTVPWNWVTAGSSIQIISPISYGGIRNINFTGANAQAPHIEAIFDFYTANQTYENLTFSDFCGSIPDDLTNGSSGSIWMDTGFGNYVNNLWSIRGGSAEKGDFQLEQQSKFHIGTIRTESQRGFGVMVFYSADVTAESLESHGFVRQTVNTCRPIKIQGTVRSQFSKCTSISSRATGLAVAVGSADNHFGQVYVTQSQNEVDISAPEYGLWFDNEYNTGNTVGLLYAINFTGKDIFVGATDTGNRVIDARISNTDLNSVSDPGAKIGGICNFAFTPTLTSDGSVPTVTYTTRTGAYWTFDGGNIVRFVVDIKVNTIAGGTGDAVIDVTALPFSGKVGMVSISASSVTLAGGYTMITALPVANNQYVLEQNGSGVAASTIAIGSIVNGSEIILTGEILMS